MWHESISCVVSIMISHDTAVVFIGCLPAMLLSYDSHMGPTRAPGLYTLQATSKQGAPSLYRQQTMLFMAQPLGNAAILSASVACVIFGMFGGPVLWPF